MSDDASEREFAGFLQRHRPMPPTAPDDEFDRLLLAARAEPVSWGVTARGGRIYRNAFLLAASVMVAVGLASHFGGDKAPAPLGTADERVESFLDETIGQALASPSVPPTGDQADYLEPFPDPDES